MDRPVHKVRQFVFAACFLAVGLAGAGAAYATPSPIYVHMNGLNDFLPKVVFVRPGQPVIWVNQDQGDHTIHAYNPRGGVHYYLCTVHAHLVKVYAPTSGKAYYLPAKRTGTHGYRGSMAGVIVVTRESALLRSNPPIVHQKILKKFWNNGDVSGH